MSPEKTAKPIEMTFALRTRVVPGNHVLDGGPEVLRDVAMATNFGTQFAIRGFVGYNCGCMIASDTLFDSRSGFSGSNYPMKTAEIECLRVVAMATNAETKIAITGFVWTIATRHLVMEGVWVVGRQNADTKGHCHGNHYLAFHGL